MGLDGTTVAAIITGILALSATFATAWMSGWNAERIQNRKNKKALARYSIPLTIAAWNLANWFYDVLEDDYYSPERCAVYGNGWGSLYTSYLLGQYFAAVHVVREMTQFFAHMKSKKAEKLKKLLWKIQDEFTSMHYDGRESLEMRWFEADILAVQEYLTKKVAHDRDGETASELRTIGWNDFQKEYYYGTGVSSLKDSVGDCEEQFQRIIYRRFQILYKTKWPMHRNPHGPNHNEDKKIREEREMYPNIDIIVPDHRVRRLQHLLSDLVDVLDAFTAEKLNRPTRRCLMSVKHSVFLKSNPPGLVTSSRVLCDCSQKACNPNQVDFGHRQLQVDEGKTHLWWEEPKINSEDPEDVPLKWKGSVEQDKV